MGTPHLQDSEPDDGATPGNLIRRALHALIPRSAWDHAPKTITSWGYASLVFLSVATIATSLAKGNLVSLVLSLVIVFALAIGLWAFSRMASATELSTFWKATGKVAGATVVASIIALFCCILIYIASGHPIWMDHWFQPAAFVSPPGNVNVRPGAASENKRRFASTDTNADTYPVGDRRSSITVSWDQGMPDDTNVEISIRQKGLADDFPLPARVVPGQAGSALIVGLRPGTVYEVRLNAELWSRRSTPVFKFVATDADHLDIGKIDDFKKIYTGALTPEGIADDTDAEMSFVALRPRNDRPAQWNYRGDVSEGLPNGRGTIETDALDCTAAMCGSQCAIESQGGKIIRGQCQLTLSNISVRRLSDEKKKTVLYDQASRYEGEIAGGEKGSASAWLGPFPIWFSGTGELEANDKEYSDVYQGTWREGGFEKGTVRGPNGGSLEGGQEYVERRCLLIITPMKGKSIGGGGGRVTCVGIELGDYRGNDHPYSGFDIGIADTLLSSTYYSQGKRTVLPTTRALGNCKPDETWGLLDASGEGDSPDWNLTCSNPSGALECSLSARAVDIELLGRKPLNDTPRISFRSSGNARGGDTPILLNGTTSRTLRALDKQEPARNMALAAELCGAETLRNVEQQQDVSMRGFCPRLAIMFNRLYTCSGPLRDNGEKVKEPNDRDFDAKDFIRPSFSEDGKTIKFSAPRPNELFYISSESVGIMSATVSAEGDSKKTVRVDFPFGTSTYEPLIASASYSDFDYGQLVRSDYLGTREDYLESFRDLINGPVFSKTSYKSYESALDTTLFYKFTFKHAQSFGTAHYRLRLPVGSLPTSADLSVVTEQDYRDAQARFKKALPSGRGLELPTHQLVALAFDEAGLPTKWRELR
ncbi:fibronectin type III domain-containing protein [Bradyrhizobium elkanii]|uniref:fibronectin type III domain-containing protein n=1 Tax=Bradyrhizobium elkanii TaxID=29448 RepID=UPI001BAD415E|nr:fibronectin type III domain-containing protein [Bradyrhizobium elkanii]MBR1164628.1 fibronectin type III domain-containing protein [Bradyrhizobium elkanii]